MYQSPLIDFTCSGTACAGRVHPAAHDLQGQAYHGLCTYTHPMMNKLLKDPARLQHAIQPSREEQKQPFHCGVNRCCHDGVTHCFICMMPTYQVSFNPRVLTEQPVTACKQYPAAILLMLVMTQPHRADSCHIGAAAIDGCDALFNW